MGFLTPLLWETEPALSLRIGTSPSGEGEHLPHPHEEGKAGEFFPYPAFPRALHTPKQLSARWEGQCEKQASLSW